MRKKYPRRSLKDRFEEKVRKTDGCWLWTGYIHPNGYGFISVEKPGHHRDVPCPAHRVSYELYVGPIPVCLHIDHLCRVPSCVNPAHLEAVTPFENTLRGMHHIGVVARTGCCVRGHRYTPENTGYQNGGYRYCRTCAKWRHTRQREARTVTSADGRT